MLHSVRGPTPHKLKIRPSKRELAGVRAFPLLRNDGPCSKGQDQLADCLLRALPELRRTLLPQYPPLPVEVVQPHEPDSQEGRLDHRGGHPHLQPHQRTRTTLVDDFKSHGEDPD